jgi:1-aminocyclopropane-1-carboxylate deaminase/D-cysteine desulfhydrase-like pyridoxal-dependent ACC family enzyme
LEAISLAASLEGFFLENTYTSKTFAGMVDLLQNDKTIKDEVSCFIHTGGLPTLFALGDEINNKLICN